jgi:hypothetical protein
MARQFLNPAPAGPSDEELNSGAITGDPRLLPFGGSPDQLQSAVSGIGDNVSGPQMNTNRAQGVMMRMRMHRQPPQGAAMPRRSKLSTLTKGY